MSQSRQLKQSKKRILIIVSIPALILLAVLFAWKWQRRGGSVIQADGHYESSLPLDFYEAFYQRDSRWAENPLGESRDTMADSGCLTCCIAASLQAQGLGEYTPGELNQLFQVGGVYNDSGAILWNELEEALPSVQVELENDVSAQAINRLLKEGACPIVKVRRKSGAQHWIMLTGTEKDTLDIIALDPIDGYVHLNDYNDRIYAVRVVTRRP